jgi:hypothetical protein
LQKNSPGKSENVPPCNEGILIMKKIENQFTNKVYLGKYHGEEVSLAAPSWDCGWYWGCGYIQNRNLHTHYNSICFSQHETYNFKKQAFEKGKYVHILQDNPDFSTHLSKSVQWQLSDYMKSFYALQEAAEVLGRGSSHYTGKANKDLKNISMCTKINNVLLPRLFNNIYNLLTSKKG